jgi:hypothetical protein
VSFDAALRGRAIAARLAAPTIHSTGRRIVVVPLADRVSREVRRGALALLAQSCACCSSPAQRFRGDGAGTSRRRDWPDSVGAQRLEVRLLLLS